MPDVLITFADGEVLHARTPEITFDLPVIEAELASVDLNSERALFPLHAIRMLIVGEIEPAPHADVLETWDRAAFRFTDGTVLRAHIGPDALLGRHGGIWSAVEPHSDELRTLAIPYAALKGIYHLRQWDSRLPRNSPARSGVEELAHIFAEREENEVPAITTRPDRPLLERVQRQGENS